MKQDRDHYFHILERVALADASHNIEGYLAEAFELGRSMVDQMVPPDEVTNIHHDAILQLTRAHPDLRLAEVAEYLTRPLIEMSMAYGMTFRRQMEQRYENMVNDRLEQSRKLEAVGTLAAGIAHDFNNILGSIVGFAEMTGDDLPEGTVGKQNIQHILKASLRARDLVARMLTFARQSPLKAVPVDMVAETGEAIALLRASLRPSVELRFQAAIGRAMIIADPVQIQQIVLNLCINAADAMGDCGLITIRITQPAAETRAATPDAGERVCLEIADNGSGMPPEVLERVFDPFFTTKAPSKGSGLGLSVVYGIVTQLGGVIEVDSRTSGPNTGTEFRVFLPVPAAEAGNQ
ncbi:MAG: ATP-binding protein [Candidatus Accumulibacter sp. UW26]|jgi:signal transduction histidine kinase